VPLKKSHARRIGRVGVIVTAEAAAPGEAGCGTGFVAITVHSMLHSK